MNVRRVTIAFLIALAVSGLCTWLLSRKISTQAALHVQEREYVAASKPLQAGEVLRLENLEMVKWPADNVIAGAFVKLEDLVGRSVLYPMDKAQPITEKFLAIAGSGFGLAAKIPTGMRAISLRSDEVMGVAGFIFPGSHLDVLVTYHSERSQEPITFTVLQDAEVLAVGQRFQPDPEGKPATATVVTLLLTPQDAERAVLASTQGTFHFVLRGGSDKNHVADVPLTLSQISGATPAPQYASARGGSSVRRAATHPNLVVETISGEKQTSDSFNGVR